ncbi:MAG TPA: MFS transporter [Dehalococcoidia bacterium]|jgi:MFS family permease|nr:MFS transporter [Dehalococcoidia bacterium]HIK89686.1 MFS transporter [Dehalococcoidia bacterium]
MIPATLQLAFRSLSNRNFRYLWFGQLLSATAMHADMVARSWLVWDLTGSSTSVASVLVARAIPMLILGLIGGVAADRFDRRKMLMVIQAWTLLMHVLMAVLLLTGVIELWHVYVLAFGLGAGMAMNQPVRTSIIPNLVERKDMFNAMSLNSIAINSTRLGGPALMAILIAATDVGWAYVWAAGAFIVVLWTTTKIDIPEKSSKLPKGNPLSQLIEGFVYIGRHRAILALVLLGFGPLSIGYAHQVLLPQLVEEQYGRGIGLLGLLTSVGAVGGLTGGLYIASRKELSRKGRLMLLAALSYGLALLGFAGATYVWMAFPLIIWIGMSQTVFRAGNSVTLMELSPDRLRGRIISATLLDTALSPVAGISAGLVADQWGVGAGYALLSAGCLAVVALTLIIYPKIRQI